ncbi:unnamed protein product [Rotaria magnacalcarata]|uniref:BTB domain-containing protein n=1 Tax=Rotaria magnacalcarata TaxID=392030 RepID=A0A820VSJ1_9BILA|nr:unnamed protein product [Rotaria magnacalcarata]
MSDSTSSSINNASVSMSVSNKHSITNSYNNFGKYIKLNVGNHLFLTSFDTLIKEDTMFKAMFSGRMEVVQDSEGKNEFNESSKNIFYRKFTPRECSSISI